MKLKSKQELVDWLKTSFVHFDNENDKTEAKNPIMTARATSNYAVVTEECSLKARVESQGMLYLSTPFSRAAADRLERMGVPAYKIGSGECNNYPLIRHIAAFGKPVILSTGMNDLDSIEPAVAILRDARIPYALLHCTSMYPTPYDKVRLGALSDLRARFPDAVLGLSDHSIGNYTCLAAVALGARVLEKHFTSDKSWPGPDIAKRARCSPVS